MVDVKVSAPKVALKTALALLASGTIDQSIFDRMTAAGAVTSGKGFGGGATLAQNMKDAGYPDSLVSAWTDARDAINEYGKAHNIGDRAVCYRKPGEDDETAPPVADASAPVADASAPVKGKGKGK